MDSDETARRPHGPSPPAEVCRSLLEALERSGVGLALTDAQDRFVYLNEAHARIYGRGADDLLGKTWRELVPPETIAPHEEAWRRSLERREVLYAEVPGYRADGSVGHHQLADVPLFDQSGAYVGHVCIVQDITERVRAEEARRASEERFRDLVENAGDLIWSIDESGRITYVNPTVERLIGLAPEEVIGHHFAEFLAPGEEE